MPHLSSERVTSSWRGNTGKHSLKTLHVASARRSRWIPKRLKYPLLCPGEHPCWRFWKASLQAPLPLQSRHNPGWYTWRLSGQRGWVAIWAQHAFRLPFWEESGAPHITAMGTTMGWGRHSPRGCPGFCRAACMGHISPRRSTHMHVYMHTCTHTRACTRTCAHGAVAGCNPMSCSHSLPVFTLAARQVTLSTSATLWKRSEVTGTWIRWQLWRKQFNCANLRLILSLCPGAPNHHRGTQRSKHSLRAYITPTRSACRASGVAGGTANIHAYNQIMCNLGQNTLSYSWHVFKK